MKKSENFFQKLFGTFAVGSSRIPLRSNIYNKKGYSAIGSTGSKIFDMERKSPLLGNANASNLLTGYFDRISELKGYQLLDISKLATNFFADYISNFLTDDGGGSRQILTVSNEDGSINEQVTERINTILTKDLKIFDFIRDHIQDYVFYGEYYSMLMTSRDETGHVKFRIEEIIDPVSVVIKKKRNQSTGLMEEIFLAKGDDGVIYEISKDEVIYLALNNLRLVNDLNDDDSIKSPKSKLAKSMMDYLKDKKKALTPTMNGNLQIVEQDGKTRSNDENRKKVLERESYMTSEPLLYSLILKVKELVIKELLVSLISLRDLSSVQIFLLQFDKAIPIESANELCARATKLANNTNELASFLTSQFDAISFIENALTQPAKFIPDYNASLGSKNVMLPLDKLSDKLLDIMQTIDQCRAGILGPLGLPITLMDSSSGSKWQVLQQSERANSRVSMFLKGIKDSISNLVCTIYRVLYKEEIDPSLVKLHICEKTSVEYNNQINQSESVNGLLNSISQILQSSLQTLDLSSGLIDPQAWLSYIQNLIKDIDPDTEPLFTDQSTQTYLQLVQAKLQQQFEQFGLDPNAM